MKPISTLALSAALLPVPSLVHGVEFESDILPIFSNKCARCHMDGSSKGGVALDADRISREIGSGKAIVPGDVDKSELIELITLPEDDGDRMPPKGSPLGDREVRMIKEWVEAGAKIGGELAEEPEMAEEKEEIAKAPDPVSETWTDTQGRTLTATLMRVDVSRKLVVLKLENGRSVEVPIANLSEESRDRAKAFWEASKR